MLVEAVAAVRSELAPVTVKFGFFDVGFPLVALEGGAVLEDFQAHPALVDLDGLIRQPVTRCQLQFLVNA